LKEEKETSVPLNERLAPSLAYYNRLQILITSAGSSGAGSTGCDATYSFVLFSAAKAFDRLK